jgi:leader peptidase (prepilin peptidase) / N-methyltransferase
VSDIFVRVAAFLFGACIGSFLNVCIARWPENLSVVAPRSRCPHCGHEIAWFENVPLLSWIALRARCRGCAQPISAIYPAVELLVACIWLGAVVAYGATFTALRVAIFATIMLGIAITDVKHYLIPDGFTVFGLLWGLAAAMIGFMIGESAPFAGPWESVLGACAGAGAIATVGWLGELALKKEAMGFGDVTLMAVVGAALGPERTLLTIFVAALLGAIVFGGIVYPVAWLRARRGLSARARAARAQRMILWARVRRRAHGHAVFESSLDATPHAKSSAVKLPLVPFGVFLAPAAVVTLLWGWPLLDWYLNRVMLAAQ